MQEELRAVHSENEKLKAKLAGSSASDILSQAKEKSGIRLLAAQIPDADMNALRTLGDQLKEKLGDSTILLASALDGKVNLVAMATDTAIQRGAHAGNLIKEAAACVGGGGGGRPNMAQAGGKNPAGIADAVKKAYEVMEAQIS